MAITASVPTMITVSTIQATPPHWAKRAIVSTSLVTRAVSSPRFDSLWSAMLSLWMWANALTRRLQSICSAACTRRM